MKAAAACLAKEDGVSLNQWISVAIAQEIGVVETAAAFLKRRSGSARRCRLATKISLRFRWIVLACHYSPRHRPR